MAVVQATLFPRKARQSGHLNVSDIPEMMPGAQPGANHAERERFEQCCRQLHVERVKEDEQIAADRRAASVTSVTVSEMEAMFPSLDAALVRTLLAEASSPQACLDTLMALAAPTDSVSSEAKCLGAALVSQNLVIADEGSFPSLLDADGWQVVGRAQLDASSDSSEYAARARRGADAPDPTPAPRAPRGPRGKPKMKDVSAHCDEAENPLTDYEFRHSVGQQRLQRRAQFGRAGGRGASAREKSDHQDETQRLSPDDAEHGCA